MHRSPDCLSVAGEVDSAHSKDPHPPKPHGPQGAWVSQKVHMRPNSTGMPIPLGAPSGRHGLDRLAHHTQRSSHMHAEHAIGNFVARTIETAAVAIAIFVSGFLDSADIPVTMQSKHR